MMDAMTWSLLSGVFQILYIHVVLGNNCHTFKDSCCTHCNPGFYLTQNCGKCVQCPVRGYADKPNDRYRCKLCNRCEEPLTYVSTCTSTRDAVCTCTAGKKCKDEKCSQCTSVQCLAGQQRDGEGCSNCPQGTFNDGTKLTCTPWKNCSALGGKIIALGNLTSDVVCGTPTTTVTPSSSSATSTTSITTIPKPVVKQAEEEDGCSCHYPEEENGGETEPMTLEA
ncbi:tumor necrosis factor receptor superfamily member 9 isoform 2-T3 [Anomaloglossus baeobatrachus]|uniref:tumor necrosis factor receptor superfamily member 9 isoform X2 n=1 Tax=Anomaloglossus baeobatrachus TaxID=238106 RepID=UPI003F4F7A8A